VKLTLKAVAIMFGVKSVKIPDPDNPQKKIDDYWGPSSKMLNDLGPDKFKQALIDFDKDNIPESIIKQIDPICDQDDFTPEAIAKVSVACEAMCMWSQAMRTYYYVAKEVEPKRIKLAAATEKLAEATASREAAEAKLKVPLAPTPAPAPAPHAYPSPPPLTPTPHRHPSPCPGGQREGGSAGGGAAGGGGQDGTTRGAGGAAP